MENKKENGYLGPNLGYFRKRKGYTQVELAERVDISPGFVSNIERGEKEVSVNVLTKLTIELDVTYDQLMYERSRETAWKGIVNALSGCPEGFEEVVEQFIRNMRKLWEDSPGTQGN